MLAESAFIENGLVSAAGPIPLLENEGVVGALEQERF